MDDLKLGLKLARDIRIPVTEAPTTSDTDQMNKYAELKVLSQFLNGFDFGVFSRLQQTQTQAVYSQEQENLLK